jgi:(2Fe-2S) ferredoxin
MIAPEHHIFVCTSCRPDGTQKGFCANKGAQALVGKFMEEIEDRELSGEVMLTNTGCFGVCDKGSIAVVYPEGIWYGGLDDDAVEAIMEEHIEGGTPVAEYQI